MDRASHRKLGVIAAGFTFLAAAASPSCAVETDAREEARGRWLIAPESGGPGCVLNLSIEANGTAKVTSGGCRGEVALMSRASHWELDESGRIVLRDASQNRIVTLAKLENSIFREDEAPGRALVMKPATPAPAPQAAAVPAPPAGPGQPATATQTASPAPKGAAATAGTPARGEGRSIAAAAAPEPPPGAPEAAALPSRGVPPRPPGPPVVAALDLPGAEPEPAAAPEAPRPAPVAFPIPARKPAVPKPPPVVAAAVPPANAPLALVPAPVPGAGTASPSPLSPAVPAAPGVGPAAGPAMPATVQAFAAPATPSLQPSAPAGVGPAPGAPAAQAPAAAGKVVARWVMKRPTGEVLCRASLHEGASPARPGASALTLSPGCAQAVTRLQLSGWARQGNELVLLGATGASLSFVPQEDGSYAKAAKEGGQPLLLVKP
ncbi:AprI/Inh family metalloprotease inhibitor [Prosthecomicrobium sp. N25]|uniref:AprI/Inh family metalloprotease inhibitor n=1 Tax=Prosthecomicrobium sp. N25 TaxID=3129254 RepID=UPI0030781CF8